MTTPTRLRQDLARYGVALISFVLAWALLQSARLFTSTPFVLFYGAIMVSGWYGGLGPGVLVTALSALVLTHQVMPVLREVPPTPASDALRLIVFVVQGALISILTENLRRAQRNAVASQHEAEEARHESALAAARTRAGEVLQDELRTRLAAIVESSDDAIVGLSPDGHVTSWNRGAERLFGWPAAEIVGRRADQVVPEDERAAFAAALGRVRGGETVGPVEAHRMRRDGSRVDVSIVLSPLRDADNEVVGASSIARDIGERRRAEEAIRRANETLERRVVERTVELERANERLAETNQQLEDANRDLERANQALGETNDRLRAANEELEAFSYSVSHDLRAPLRAIDGFSRILMEDAGAQLDDEGRRQLGQVRENAQKMGALINDLLAFSRAARQPLGRSHVDVDALVRGVIADLAPEIAGRNVTVTVGALPPCEADSAMLRQVFVNLISNAFKYTRTRAEAHVEVGAVRQDGEVVYQVRDDGVGFDMKYAGKLFNVFQRLHRADEYEGTGAGLAIARRIVVRHGGRIWTEAAPDRGATFSFTIGCPAPATAAV